jgi:hypothetical protein
MIRIKKTLKNLFGNIVCIVVLFLLSSCSSMYIPANTNIPLLDKVGEKQVDLYFSNTGFHFTGNHAITDKYAVMVNSSLSYKNFSKHYDVWDFLLDGTSDESLFGESEFAHHYNEIGFGRYNLFDSRIKGEFFGGIGYGVAKDKLYNDDYNLTYRYDTEYWLGFIQYNMGRKFRKIDIGGGIRVGYSGFNYTFPDEDITVLVYKNEKFNNFFIEPVFIVKFGNEKIKFVIRVGVSVVQTFNFNRDLNITKGTNYGSLNTTPLHFSVGLNLGSWP